MKGKIGSASSIISTFTRKDCHPGQKGKDRRELILECLKDTRCAMGPDQIREWVYANRMVSLKILEVWRNLRLLQGEGSVIHPTAHDTKQFVYKRE